MKLIISIDSNVIAKVKTMSQVDILNVNNLQWKRKQVQRTKFTLLKTDDVQILAELPYSKKTKILAEQNHNLVKILHVALDIAKMYIDLMKHKNKIIQICVK
ncbi:hypothetical protein CHS0354_000266 [Potamilus streckersoni]|uniref:Uncharacterized protein n=1 Tax=Potamilus streckersoni TaxID=2493646 RepID=A0AAE0RZ70_9BIVA|nr:hypothetical protein CHS0354_000266 [Potamilus streckersoni]